MRCDLTPYSDFVLETLEHARRREAPISGIILGFGFSNDAHHMTAPLPSGAQAARAMRLALAEVGIAPEEADCINAHGSGTPLNDATETLAIKQVLGDHAYRIPATATKAMHWHSLGAAGAIEAAISFVGLRHGYVPPTLNLREPDEACDLDYVTGHGRETPLRYVLSNSFGFGGINRRSYSAAPWRPALHGTDPQVFTEATIDTHPLSTGDETVNDKADSRRIKFQGGMCRCEWAVRSSARWCS